MEKYYNVFGFRNDENKSFALDSQHTSKKAAFTRAKELGYSMVTKTVQDDGNNQGRIIAKCEDGILNEDY